MEDKIEKPKIKLIGEDGNVFYLIGICTQALKDAGQSDKAKEMLKRVVATRSYDEVLHIMEEYCEIN